MFIKCRVRRVLQWVFRCGWCCCCCGVVRFAQCVNIESATISPRKWCSACAHVCTVLLLREYDQHHHRHHHQHHHHTRSPIGIWFKARTQSPAAAAQRTYCATRSNSLHGLCLCTTLELYYNNHFIITLLKTDGVSNAGQICLGK